jgi:hypothetical protein
MVTYVIIGAARLMKKREAPMINPDIADARRLQGAIMAPKSPKTAIINDMK